MQVANEQTVLGDFSDASFTHFKITSRFFKRDGRFFVNTEGPNGEPADFEIKYTFGVEPLQQYLIMFPGGKLQALTIAWDAQRNRWFHLQPDEKISAGDPFHWTGRYQRWNAMCADCHATNLRKGYALETDTYETAWAEINVSCQACHGPGSAHEAWARARGEGGARGSGGTGLRVNFATSDSRTEIESCAPCHALRHGVSGAYKEGDRFLDHYVPQVLHEGRYHPDGQIDAEVYVYGSFVQSRMYAQGVRCTDCHEPHSLKLGARGNDLCAQCHQPAPPTRFPTLKAGNYDTSGHHHHLEGTEAARCVSCHMPGKNFMVIDLRHDHSFRVPRPDLSVKLGTPNACNDCHADKSAAWAASAVEGWYGPERRRDPHYGEVIAAGRAGDPEAEKRLIALAGDAGQPAIVRATALELLQRFGPAGIEAIAAATGDEAALVRATAVGGLDRLPPSRKVPLLAPLLQDPVRAVRVEAARVLATVPADLFEPAQRQAFEAALKEFMQAQMAAVDMPWAHLNRAFVQAGLGEVKLAEQSYLTALRLDPGFLPARINLANLYNRMGRNEDAEREFREAIKRAPEEGDLYYSLGLLLAEEGRLDASAEALGKAAALLPDRARVHYNLGLVLQKLGRPDEAGSALSEAHRLSPRDPQAIYALALLYMNEGRWERALPYAEKLSELSPSDPNARELVRRIQGEMSRH